MDDIQPLKYPMADISPDQKQALYIGILERKVSQQTIMMLQYRTLLEALTGEPWDEIDTRLKKGELLKVASNAFERNLARDLAEAERMVQANLEAANAQHDG